MVAEGSRSLNLANNGQYDEIGDGLWVGCSRGPVAGTLCEVNFTSVEMSVFGSMASLGLYWWH